LFNQIEGLIPSNREEGKADTAGDPSEHCGINCARDSVTFEMIAPQGREKITNDERVVVVVDDIHLPISRVSHWLSARGFSGVNGFAHAAARASHGTGDWMGAS
jgi:hypothetical protein